MGGERHLVRTFPKAGQGEGRGIQAGIIRFDDPFGHGLIPDLQFTPSSGEMPGREFRVMLYCAPSLKNSTLPESGPRAFRDVSRFILQSRRSGSSLSTVWSDVFDLQGDDFWYAMFGVIEDGRYGTIELHSPASTRGMR